MAAKDGIVVKVQVPAMSGYSTKKFDRNMTVAQAISQINNTIPSSLRSDRYRLYCNSLRMLDEDRTLGSYGVKDNVRNDLQIFWAQEATHAPSHYAYFLGLCDSTRPLSNPSAFFVIFRILSS